MNYFPQDGIVPEKGRKIRLWHTWLEDGYPALVNEFYREEGRGDTRYKMLVYRILPDEPFGALHLADQAETHDLLATTWEYI